MSAVVVLSLDTEGAWGTYTAAERALQASAYERLPHLIERLVSLLSVYELPATWAVVAAYTTDADAPIPVEQPHYSFATAPDDARRQAGPPHWYHHPGVMDTILGARTPQEVATHTYTHLLADDPAVTATALHAQLEAVAQHHRALGLPPPTSIVYPQNRVAHLDVLRNHGYRAYRGPQPGTYPPTRVNRARNLAQAALAVAPPVYPLAQLTPVNGLANLPASQFLMSFDGVRGHIPPGQRVRAAQRGLDAAQRVNGLYHLWFHPFNLGSSDAMFDCLVAIFAELHQRRARGHLDVLTMADLATRLLAQQPTASG